MASVKKASVKKASVKQANLKQANLKQANLKQANVKKGDTVEVIAGKSKGLTGTVLRVFPDQQKVLVEGANRVTKHTKVGQTQRGAKTGGIVHQEAPIHISNVMLVDPDSKKRTRVGVRVEDDGTKVRVAKRSGKDIS